VALSVGWTGAALAAAMTLAAPALARAEDTGAGLALAAAPHAEIRALIGETATETSGTSAVIHLGPADADWSDLGAPINLPLSIGAGRRAGWRGGAPGGDDATCLTQAVYYEARSEPLEGQEAVAQVVMNRAHDGRFAPSVCGVVFQRAGHSGTCQFTFACDGSMDRLIEPTAWTRAKSVATQALGGFTFEPTKDATHYHADYVTPRWSVTLPRIRQIGRHIFYQ
jgi:hypothetical protein